MSTFVHAHASFFDKLLILALRTAEPQPARNRPVSSTYTHRARPHVLRRGRRRRRPSGAARCEALPAPEQADLTGALPRRTRPRERAALPDSESICGHHRVSLGRAGRAGDEGAQRGQAETGDWRAVPLVQVRARAARGYPKTDQSPPSTDGACARRSEDF
jgi:hypothetical protein